MTELSVAGWLASVAEIADEADRDRPDLLLWSGTSLYADSSTRRTARRRPDQEAA